MSREQARELLKKIILNEATAKEVYLYKLWLESKIYNEGVK